MSIAATGIRGGFLARLKAGLGHSRRALTDGIGGIFSRQRVDQEALDALEELLIGADLGVETAAELVAALAKTRFGKDISADDVRATLAEQIRHLLEPVAKPLAPDFTHRPQIIVVVGVNGTGKTTTIGKLARQFRAEGRSVMVVAGDSFRAAAVEQLRVWAERAGADFVSGREGADAAGLAYDALIQARAKDTDLVLIDTAGRLQNKAHLMAELTKIGRVLRKLDPTAPQHVLLVLDATTGQNAHSQVELFRAATEVSGLIVTKLDGSARGGVVVALARRFGLPVHAVGVGEAIDDLRPFTAAGFANSLLGLDDKDQSG